MDNKLITARPMGVEYDVRAEEIVVIAEFSGPDIEPEQKTFRFPAPTSVDAIYERIERDVRDMTRELAPQVTVARIQGEIGRGLVVTATGPVFPPVPPPAG